MNNLKIHKVTRNDYSDLKELMLHALKTDPTAFTVDHSEYANSGEYWWQNYLNDYLNGIFSEMFFAKDSNQILGMCGIVYNKRNRLRHIASIVWFYVRPEKRGQGIGKFLVNYAMDHLEKNKNIKKVSLTVVSEQETAIEMYKKLGFEIAGTQKDELNIDGKFFDFIIMEKHKNL